MQEALIIIGIVWFFFLLCAPVFTIAVSLLAIAGLFFGAPGVIILLLIFIIIINLGK